MENNAAMTRTDAWRACFPFSFLVSALIALAFVLCQCSEASKDVCVVQGEIQGLDDGQLVLWGNDRLFNRADTITATQGTFLVEIPIDTLAETTLLTPDGREHPLFLQKGETVHLSGSLPDSLRVSGVAQNDTIYPLLVALALPENQHPDSIRALTEDFIRNHPSDPASVYVLRRYVIEADSLDVERLRSTLQLFAPAMHDYGLVSQMDDYLNQLESSADGKTMPMFGLPDAEGKIINRYTYGGKLLLVHFWASWNAESREQGKTYRKLYDKYVKRQKPNKKNKFDILGISLDGDRRQWQQAIEEDSVRWEQVCNFKAWETEVVKRLKMDELPATVLVSDRGIIIGRDLSIDQIEEEIKNMNK